ncbi:MAG: imidazole glycerol phosphate synthase subunit HisH [Bryobacterales bacterium]|nr:imidazole glycerol phosphate synthase subunit HisH [Bryobacterales bacterium]MDE0294396.1 imidazole glycerol phosphate synthase subunit HisH [Bryobacterales bacterium]
MIAIFDYGAGNLRSVENALDAIEVKYEIVNDAEGLARAERIILPGVGHFGQLIRSLDSLGVREAFKERISAGVPFLGICLGLHALFERSEEAPELDGLGVYPGEVKRFPKDARVPHMGWNELESQGSPRLLANLPSRPYVYFAHSYYVPEEIGSDNSAALCEYGVRYTAALEAGNVFGVQFHPEKSGSVGQQIVRNFLAC